MDTMSLSLPNSNSHRFAYVMMHYEGTNHDCEYLLGLRTLLASIRMTKTPHDIVVLISDNVRKETQKELIGDDENIQLKTVKNLPNPFKDDASRRRSYRERFQYTFNKLYLWNMTEYERVIYMDSDNIVLSNMDHLFYCGHFCVVFMNPLLFHTGLLVVKPNRKMFDHLVDALVSMHSFSHDGADQGFLVSQFDVEDAPLFHPDQIEQKPFEYPAMRLALGYNMNHFYFYPSFSWDFFRRTDFYFSKNVLPMLTLAYPSPPILKPWYWYPPLFFTEHRHWHNVRATLGINYWMEFMLPLVALVVFMIVSHFFLKPLMRSERLDKFRRLSVRIARYNPVWFGSVIGVFCFFLCGIITFFSIYSMLPPPMGFFLWCILHISLFYTCLDLFVRFLLPFVDIGRDAAVAPLQSTDFTGWRSFFIMVLAQSLCFVWWLPLYFHFILKLAAIVLITFFWIVIDASLFRKAAVRLIQSSKVL